MTIEFWSKRRRTPMPKLPISASKAHQKLSQSIICGDDELASWLDGALKRGLVTGTPADVQQLRERLDKVIVPLDGPDSP